MKKITDYAELVKEKHALNSALGPVETDLSDASRDYAIGEEFVYDGGLYRAKTAILQHDALVLNTNYEAADSITGQIASVNQALTKYANAQSNPNLLDNPWFTVNQRGKPNYNENGYSADRWLIYTSDNTKDITVNKGISFESGFNGIFYQRLEDSLISNLRNKKVTISVLLNDDTIIKNSFIFPNTDPDTVTDYGNIEIGEQWYIRILCNTSSNIPWSFQIHTWGQVSRASLSVKALKFELGEVSTLAMDTAPNYAEELLKCQRYFVQKYMPFTFMDYGSSTKRAIAELPVPMRIINPLITVVGDSDGKMYEISGYASSDNLTGVTFGGKDTNNIIQIIADATSMIAQQTQSLVIFRNIQISADL